MGDESTTTTEAATGAGRSAAGGVLDQPWPTPWRRLVLAGIILVSLLLRVTYFCQLNSSSCVWQHLWTESDMHFFDIWGKAISQGDWLSSRLDYPYLDWHRRFAEAYFQLHPEQKNQFVAEGRDPNRALWDRWFGGKRFYQEPLYAYFVGLTYWLCGPDPRWVFAWQMVLGIASNVLIYRISRRCFGDLAGTIAGLMASFCGITLYFELILLREPLLVFLSLALVAASMRAVSRNTLGAWLATGMIAGLACLAKSIFMPFTLALAMMMGVVCRGRWRTWWRSLAGLALGLGFWLSLQAARDAAVGVTPLSPPFTGILTFIADNNAGSQPNVNSMDTETIIRVVSETEGRTWPAVRATLATHESLSHFLGLVGSKFAVLWSWYEIPDNCNFYFYRIYAPVLNQAIFTFFLVAPLSMVGLGLALPRFRSCWILYYVVGMHWGLLLVFLPLSRYRLLLLVAVLPFAGLTVACVVRHFWKGQWRRGGLIVAAILALLLWTGRAMPPEMPLARLADAYAPYAHYYAPLVDSAQRNQNWDQAAGLIAELLLSEPVVLIPQNTGAIIPHRSGRNAAEFFAFLHHKMASLLMQCGKPKEAVEHSARAASLDDAVRQFDAATKR